jgi:hypothetical protein
VVGGALPEPNWGDVERDSTIGKWSEVRVLFKNARTGTQNVAFLVYTVRTDVVIAVDFVHVFYYYDNYWNLLVCTVMCIARYATKLLHR